MTPARPTLERPAHGPARGPAVRPVSLAGVLAVLAGALAAGPTGAAVFTVTNTANEGAGSLRDALEQANETPLAGDIPHVIDFDLPLNSTIEIVDSSLPLIATNLEIDGEDVLGVLTISGGGGLPLFFVESGTVAIRNLRLAEGVAEGGDGADRGGGGLGAGGALFVDQNATVLLDGVTFDANRAEGGDAGLGQAAGGGGGGFHGDGGAGAGGGGGFGGDGGTAGGGGGGSSTDGADGAGTRGGDGGGLGTEADPELANGGAGGQGASVPGEDGGDNQGGGGSRGGIAGNGGLGGGGGGSTGPVAGNGGDFGGGGGTPVFDGTAGDGGFGGGGGGASSSGTAGEGGFGAGDGTNRSGQRGDGGSAFGGAVFVRSGGVLRIVDSDFGGSLDNVAGTGQEDGEAAGADLYLMEDVVLTFEVSQGRQAQVGEPGSTSSIGGDGRLVKTGEGTLFLNGANTYTGGTALEEGRIQGEARSLQGDIEVRSGTTLRVQQDSGPGTMSANLEGAGGFEKAGDATVTLEGTSTFTGTTRVRAGRLAVTPGALTGAVRFEPDGGLAPELEFAQTRDGSFAGTIAGSGRVLKSGPGTLTLTAANSYSGGTAIEAGVLAGTATSLQGDITVDAGAELRFDQTNTGAYAGDVNGDGRLRKRGAARLTVSGTLAHTGGTLVDQGTLALSNATLGGGVDVGSAGALAGFGAIGGSVGLAGRLLAPAASEPSLDIAAALELEGGSRIDLTVNRSDARTPRVQVAGTATLRGVEVGYDTSGSFDTTLETFPIVEAAGGFVDAGGVTIAPDSDGIFLDEQVEVDAGQLVLRIRRNGETVATIARTPNQRAVATALLENEADFAALLGPFEALTLDEALDSLDSLSGESLGSLTQALYAGSQQFVRRIAGRMGSRRVASPRGVPPLTYEPPTWIQGNELSRWRPPAPIDDPERVSADGPILAFGPAHGETGWGGWMDGYGILSDVDGGSAAGSHAADIAHFGTAFGLDYQLAEGWLAGLAGSFAHSDVELGALAADTTAQTYRFALYGARATPRYWLGVLAGYGYTPVESERRVAFGSFDQRASADFGVHEWTAYAEAGYSGLERWGATLQPMAGLFFSQLDQEGFRERGGADIRLAVAGQQHSSLAPNVGLQLERPITLEAFTANWVPELHVRYARELLDVDRRVDARLAAATSGSAFAVAGSELGRDQVVVGTSYLVNTDQALSLSIGYDLLWNETQLGHRFSLGGLLRW